MAKTETITLTKKIDCFKFVAEAVNFLPRPRGNQVGFQNGDFNLVPEGSLVNIIRVSVHQKSQSLDNDHQLQCFGTEDKKVFFYDKSSSLVYNTIRDFLDETNKTPKGYKVKVVDTGNSKTDEKKHDDTLLSIKLEKDMTPSVNSNCKPGIQYQTFRFDLKSNDIRGLLLPELTKATEDDVTKQVKLFSQSDKKLEFVSRRYVKYTNQKQQVTDNYFLQCFEYYEESTDDTTTKHPATATKHPATATKHPATATKEPNIGYYDWATQNMYTSINDYILVINKNKATGTMYKISNERTSGAYKTIKLLNGTLIYLTVKTST